MFSDTQSSKLFQSPYFTSGFETASLLSSNAQTAFLSGDLFSQVVIPTLVPAHIRLPEYYTAEHSIPPTPNFADYPLRVDGITIYDPQNDPRFPILAERFINNNDLLSHKRKETELKRLQTPNLELKFEVKVKFQGLNPHPIFHVSKKEHKPSPAPFEVVHSDTENYLPSDDPNITNLMVSHYNCAKQHNLRQFNLLNVKQCTEAPSDIKHASVKARVYARAKAKRIKAFKCVAYAKKEYAFKVP